ncbi:ComF family protein [Tropicimonas sp.]|uniref:ComF family protein n=1 Tax=Tropicimonas sp. TaxID=2067044 RepID=UPI003A848147
MSESGILHAAARGLSRIIYPPACLTCNAIVGTEGAFCGPCWRETPFIAGLVCDLCGVPLPGDDPGEPVLCDDCLRIARPWSRGRAAMLYRGNARRFVLMFKHADRTELARPAARWMAAAGCGLLLPGMIVAPVPLHWRRLFLRRYNQSALLAQALGRETGLTCLPDLLQRPRHTGTQEGRNRDARFANLQGAIRVHPRRARQIKDRPVLIVDDVMTSGATFAAAAEACLAAGAADVRVLALARVAKDD